MGCPVKNKVHGLVLALLLFTQALTLAQEKPKPCKCVCGGEMACPAGTIGYCECVNSYCNGSCLTRPRDRRELAAAILNVVTNQGFPPGGLQSDPHRFAGILGQLLSSGSGNGFYSIEYQGRTINFSIPEEAAASLRDVKRELETGGAATDRSTKTFNQTLRQSGVVELCILIIFLIMYLYTTKIAIERFFNYRAATRQSREFAPRVAQALKNNRIKEAFTISKTYRKSHLAMVVNFGLQELLARDDATYIAIHEIQSLRLAAQRAIAYKDIELRKGLSGMMSVVSSSLLLGMLGLVVGISKVLLRLRINISDNFADAFNDFVIGIFLLALGLSLFILSKWLFNYFEAKIKGFIVEMENSASELVDYAIKTRQEKVVLK